MSNTASARVRKIWSFVGQKRVIVGLRFFLQDTQNMLFCDRFLVLKIDQGPPKKSRAQIERIYFSYIPHSNILRPFMILT